MNASTPLSPTGGPACDPHVAALPADHARINVVVARRSVRVTIGTPEDNDLQALAAIRTAGAHDA